MKILHLIPSMGGGGAERQLTYLCMELVRSGCEGHVGLLYGGPNMERLERSGAVINKLKCQSNYDPLLIYRIARLISRIRPDIVQSWIAQMDVFGGLAAKLTGVPFVMTERSTAQNYSGGWKNCLRKIVAANASYIVANSQAGRDYWLSQGMERERLSVIRNAIPFVDIESFTCDPATQEIPTDAESIVYSGRYSYEKNPTVMLEAFRQVLNARPEATVYMFGDGPMKNDFIAFRDKHGLADRLRVGGYTSQLWGIFKTATLFVSVSSFEGTPNTVLEAVACGCPVVLSDTPSHREILDDASAWFVPVDSPPTIARGILSVLADRKEAQVRAVRARSIIKRWSPAAIAAEYLELYGRITRQPSVFVRDAVL